LLKVDRFSSGDLYPLVDTMGFNDFLQSVRLPRRTRAQFHPTDSENLESMHSSNTNTITHSNGETIYTSEPTSDQKADQLLTAVKSMKKLDSIQALKRVLHCMYVLDDVIPEKIYQLLTEILGLEHNLLRMINILTQDGSDTSDTNLQPEYEADARGGYEYRYVITLYLSYGPTVLRERILDQQKLLRPLILYITATGPRSVIVLEYVSRVLASLLHQEAKVLLIYMLSFSNFCRNAVRHIGCSALSNLLPRMLCEHGFFLSESLRFDRMNLHALHIFARDDIQMLIAKQVEIVIQGNVNVLGANLVLQNGLNCMRNISLRGMMALANELEADDRDKSGRIVARKSSTNDLNDILAKFARNTTVFSNISSTNAQMDALVQTSDRAVKKLDLFRNVAPIQIIFDAARSDDGFWAYPEVILHVNRFLEAYLSGFFSAKPSIIATVRTQNVTALRDVLLNTQVEFLCEYLRKNENRKKVTQMMIYAVELLARLVIISDTKAVQFLVKNQVATLILDVLFEFVECDMLCSLIVELFRTSLDINAVHVAYFWFVSGRLSERFQKEMSSLSLNEEENEEKSEESPIGCARTTALLELGRIIGSFLNSTMHNDVIERQLRGKMQNFDNLEVFFTSFVDDEDQNLFDYPIRRRASSFSDAVVFDEDEGEALWIYNMLIDRDAWGDLSDGKVNAKRNAADSE